MIATNPKVYCLLKKQKSKLHVEVGHHAQQEVQVFFDFLWTSTLTTAVLGFSWYIGRSTAVCTWWSHHGCFLQRKAQVDPSDATG